MLLSLYLFSTSLYSRTSPDVWDVIRSQLVLNHEASRPEVQAQIRWFLGHPHFLQKLALAEPYIYHIITEVRRKKLPGELALLPMIESAYDPFAYSTVGAAGLWQFMPATGSHWGLKQDWWFDGRRSIPSSTEAALKYLNYLGRYFDGNWLLAIAAYDAGEGAVSRSVKSSGQASYNTNFWTLSLPSETKTYVPRLLALAEIINHPQRYHLNLPEIPHAPYFTEVDVGSQIDLSNAAKLAGISYRDLIKLNPGYNRWATAPYKPFKLLIPTDKVLSFSRNLANVPVEKRVSWTRHTVRNGDTLGSIAHAYFTTAKLIQELNQLKTDKLHLGQSLLLPSSKNLSVPVIRHPAPIIEEADRPASYQTYKVIHIVQPSDTYQVLERKYNVSAASIRNWNRMEANASLPTGVQLIIWKRTVQYGLYTVQTGDSLNTIAKRNNTDPQTLNRLNPGINTKMLKPGQRLVIG
ncbi:Membrane-bound lytic murein transglycosylase D precursor [Legionella massiliensis]|uniref:Membrane-bound lytic murein transglycosylase D n=1 Tax=Legionella massiliensis TaxID=1034943 RepID=A0A078KUR8_9GAMM|nr:Membrane-bound lytic murein transglycosylase D precursor [Legionella massiliensis]CEE13938.1 Membrane-bound lytic murein transglycosylase D precursor [Legionella massiliensis]